MCPVLFRIGNLVIHTYGVLVAVGLVIGFQVVLYWAKKFSLAENKIQDVIFYAVIFGFIGARLFYVFAEWDNYRSDILGILRVWEGGLVFYGGLLGGALAVLFLVKKFELNLWRVADILVAGLSLGQFFGRLGCFSAGCCYGRPAPANLGVVFTNPESLAILGIPLYPTQLLEAFFVLCLFVLLTFILRKSPRPGVVFSLYLTGYGLIRFFVEFWRGDPFLRHFWLGLSLAQVISLLAVIFGVGLLNYFLFQ